MLVGEPQREPALGQLRPVAFELNQEPGLAGDVGHRHAHRRVPVNQPKGRRFQDAIALRPAADKRQQQCDNDRAKLESVTEK